MITNPLQKAPKRILYAIQGTGNGHVARAREIIPILKKYGTVDIVLSGDQSHVELPEPVTYFSKGLTFIYNKSGGVSLLKTLLKNNLLKIFNEVRRFPVHEYDVVINDFECITAWACKWQKKTCYGLGHQASFISEKTPRPTKKQFLGEAILKWYAPCTHPVGFHFDTFDKGIFKPVIRSEIRAANIMDNGHYTVYLPAFSDEKIFEILKEIPQVKWEVFSKRIAKPVQKGHVHFFPVSNSRFIQSFTTCTGIFTSSGFETPAEALYMGKKVLTIPIKNQYEQYCNASAMSAIGIPVLKALSIKTLPQIKEWVQKGFALNIDYPNDTERIIEREIMQSAGLV